MKERKKGRQTEKTMERNKEIKKQGRTK
jgi:hypothetical protein